MAKKNSPQDYRPQIKGADELMNELVNLGYASDWSAREYVWASPEAIRKKLGKRKMCAEYQGDANSCSVYLKL